ncbi:hypothetical protein, partial [Pseudoponticoccus marisrubri]|uniref:hypothetical protein n=1 Tax=Pseudoponticoccus marisrubri TaxID=1685382 RepID=UPI001969DC40
MTYATGLISIMQEGCRRAERVSSLVFGVVFLCFERQKAPPVFLAGPFVLFVFYRIESVFLVLTRFG